MHGADSEGPKVRARAPLLRPGGGPSVEYSDAQALDLAWFVGQDRSTFVHTHGCLLNIDSGDCFD